MARSLRAIEKIFTAPLINEINGVQLRRAIGTSTLRRLDPFLMLDYISSPLGGGFPPHPHRGFEVVTYMKQGTMRHMDSHGNKGSIQEGDCQWMTVGKGLVHCELPSSPTEHVEAFQLWINLMNKDRFCDPQYQEITKDKIPIVTKNNTTVKVIAGQCFETTGPVYRRTPAFYLDVDMKANGSIEQQIPKLWNGFCYVYRGSAYFGPNEEKAEENQLVLLKNEEPETLVIKTTDQDSKFIIVAGQPLNEPIVRHYYYVLGKKEEVQQTLDDYEQNKNGFEGAKEFMAEFDAKHKMK